MNVPKVSVLIAAWNRKDDLLQTIQSVYDQDYRDFEIIVVDNGSTDDTCDAIPASFPDVRLIRLEENRGATGGRNAGIPAARGEIIFCLDSDASPARGTLKTVAAKFDADPALGVVNSKVLNAFTREFDRSTGWAYSEKQKQKSDEEFFTHNFSETGCAIRKTVFEKAGFFWDRLFFGREGEDLALRVLDAGYKILYCPSAVVLHRVSPQKRVASAERRYFDFRNSLYIYLVRYPWWLLTWFLPLKVAAEVFKGLRKGGLGWVAKALGDVLKNFIGLMKERKPIRNETARMYLRFQREQGALSWNLSSWMRSKA